MKLQSDLRVHILAFVHGQLAFGDLLTRLNGRALRGLLARRGLPAFLPLLLVLLALAGVARAQVRTADPIRRGLQLTDFPRFVKLADNVYGYEEIRQPGFTTVSLVVIGHDGVLIADGQGSVQATQMMLDRIKTLSPLPVRWYVVGSDHGDHTGGNAALPNDVTIITRAGMSGDERSVDLGGTTVRIVFLGRAHTGTDLSVQLPRERILFMSEAYLNRVFPAMRSAFPSEWVRVIDRALAMDVDRFVPGHGFIEEPSVSREELVAFRDALRYVIAEGRRLHGLGLPAADATAQANWGQYTGWFLREQQAPIAIRKVYEEIEGKLPLPR
jgi:glyoxylase-like metal-dependent hydrolase (beta-lactamase superfamily II)